MGITVYNTKSAGSTNEKLTISLNKEKYRILCYIGGCFLDYYPLRKIVYSGEKECYGLQLENGMYIIGTPDHEILTDKGYIPIKDCVNQNFITYAYIQDTTSHSSMSDALYIS